MRSSVYTSAANQRRDSGRSLVYLGILILSGSWRSLEEEQKQLGKKPQLEEMLVPGKATDSSCLLEGLSLKHSACCSSQDPVWTGGRGYLQTSDLEPIQEVEREGRPA